MLEQNPNFLDEFDNEKEEKRKEKERKKEEKRKKKEDEKMKKEENKTTLKAKGFRSLFRRNNACFTYEFFDGYPFQKYDNIT